MKKFLSFLCLLGVLGLVAACDNNKTEAPQSQVTANQPQQTKTKEQIEAEQRGAFSTEMLRKPDNLDKPLP
ncbi:hypothetical protein [Desulfobulbus elongatus]|uniref:hypothetical protein n=1 Tax=Desulfobulbus elongatus TaxID=53332 RepID=UPI000483543C|nr:hypothetical protein [Desulfobulbus elongatus]